MPSCSWEHFVSQNMFLAALIRWVCFQSGFLEGLAPSSAICVLIFCRYIPVSRDILSKKVSLLENRLVGELAGNQAGFLSAYLLLELTRSWGMFHFDKSAFFQWKNICQKIFAHSVAFSSLSFCPDKKIWLLKLAQISCFPLQARCWGYFSLILSPGAMPIGCDANFFIIFFSFCSFSITILYTILPEYCYSKNT